jgi:PAS domain S-box-containing protein
MARGASHLPHHEGRDPALRALAEAASENASIITADGTFIEVSSNVAAMALAHGLSDLRGHSLFEFMGPEDEAIERNLRDILRDGKPGKFEYITADRRRRLTYRFEVRVAPLPNQPVGAPLFAVFAHDLTPRGTVEQQRAVTEFGQYALRAAKDDELLSQAVKVTARHFARRLLRDT